MRDIARHHGRPQSDRSGRHAERGVRDESGLRHPRPLQVESAAELEPEKSGPRRFAEGGRRRDDDEQRPPGAQDRRASRDLHGGRAHGREIEPRHRRRAGNDDRARQRVVERRRWRGSEVNAGAVRRRAGVGRDDRQSAGGVERDRHRRGKRHDGVRRVHAGAGGRGRIGRRVETEHELHPPGAGKRDGGAADRGDPFQLDGPAADARADELVRRPPLDEDTRRKPDAAGGERAPPGGRDSAPQRQAREQVWRARDPALRDDVDELRQQEGVDPEALAGVVDEGAAARARLQAARPGRRERIGLRDRRRADVHERPSRRAGGKRLDRQRGRAGGGRRARSRAREDHVAVRPGEDGGQGLPPADAPRTSRSAASRSRRVAFLCRRGRAQPEQGIDWFKADGRSSEFPPFPRSPGLSSRARPAQLLDNQILSQARSRPRPNPRSPSSE